MTELNPYMSLMELNDRHDKVATCERPLLPKETSCLTVVGIVGPLLLQSLGCCACGHLPLAMFPVTLLLFLCAIYGYSSLKNRTAWGLIGVAASLLLLGKHAGDVLWLGHDALITF